MRRVSVEILRYLRDGKSAARISNEDDLVVRAQRRNPLRYIVPRRPVVGADLAEGSQPVREDEDAGRDRITVGPDKTSEEEENEHLSHYGPGSELER